MKWYKPDSTNHRTGRWRANQLLKAQEVCELESISGCHGPLHVHHKDANPVNNAPINLIKLCVAHHCLVEHERIDLANPVMPSFFVSSGKRRYAHTYNKQTRRRWKLAWLERRKEQNNEAKTKNP